MNHLKYIIKLLIAVIIVTTTVSCDKDEPAQPAYSNRTILVYIVANNSLGAENYDETDINEMILASQNNNFNNGRLIIYHAPLGSKPTLKEIVDGKIITLKEYNTSLSSVERKQMQQVINDTKLIAPAKDYGLILWSHANGWLQTGINEGATPPIKYDKGNKSTLAFGDDQGKQMNITTLAQILENEKFSFIYFDCCYMATIEVMYELCHTTDYIIASATEIPADGMPYEQNLPLLFSDTALLELACANTFDYYNCKNGLLRSCAISLIDTHHIKELGEITAQIYRYARPRGYRQPCSCRRRPVLGRLAVGLYAIFHGRFDHFGYDCLYAYYQLENRACGRTANPLIVVRGTVRVHAYA